MLKQQNKIKTISFGGLGDSQIVLLKLLELKKENVDIDIDHLFVESNPKTIYLISEFCKTDMWCDNDWLSLSYEIDEDYQKSFFEKKWKDRIGINTSVNGNYHFPTRDDIVLKNCTYYGPDEKGTRYDFSIQVAAGVNSNRKWHFDPNILAFILRQGGYSVCLVGSDLSFKEESDEDNYVGKSLDLSMKAVHLSRCHIGLSGFHTYRSLSFGIPCVYLSESDEHDKHYIADEWKTNAHKLKFGTLTEVLSKLRGLEYKV